LQKSELNRSGELYVIRKPNLKTKIVDGTSLAVAAVLHMIPRGTKDVLLLGDATKVSTVLASSLCQRGIQVYNACMHACMHAGISRPLLIWSIELARPLLILVDRVSRFRSRTRTCMTA
jgi:hypothetical protein